MSFHIVTDACCDLPGSYLVKQHDLVVLSMSYQMSGTLYEIDLLDPALPARTHAFYERLSDGEAATTSQINQTTWHDALTPLLRAGEDALVVPFSSALSGTFLAAQKAAEELAAEFPQRRLLVLDSRSASLGQGLLVHYLLAYRDQGHSLQETFDYGQTMRQRVNHWFTVDDLQLLRRGGRVTASSAYLGSILKIKPILNVDPDGHLVPRDKVQGRKRSLRELFRMAERYALQPDRQTMFISHADAEKDALKLDRLLKDELHVPEILISTIGPIIGSHTGQGTLALFFTDKAGEGRLETAGGA